MVTVQMVYRVRTSSICEYSKGLQVKIFLMQSSEDISRYFYYLMTKACEIF